MVLQHAVALLPSTSIIEDVGVISRLTRSCQLYFVVAQRCIAAFILFLYHGFQHAMVSLAFSCIFQFVSCLIQPTYSILSMLVVIPWGCTDLSAELGTLIILVGLSRFHLQHGPVCFSYFFITKYRFLCSGASSKCWRLWAHERPKCSR